MGVSVAEPVVMSEKRSSWKRARDLDRATTHRRGSGRRAHDSVARVGLGELRERGLRYGHPHTIFTGRSDTRVWLYGLKH